MTWADLISDDATGRVSHTKCWVHIANAALTVGFLKVVWTAPASDALSMLFLTFGGVVAGSQLASRLMGLKWRAPSAGGSTTTTAASEERTTTVIAPAKP